MTTLFEKEAPHPLADRLRPQRLLDIVGQDHLLGPEGPIGRMVASRQLASMILWGPPGCGQGALPTSSGRTICSALRGRSAAWWRAGSSPR